MIFIFGLLLLTLNLGHVHLAVMSFTDCGNGEVERITIEPCSLQPCHFDQGQLANVTVTFTSRQSASSVYVKSTLRRGGLFPFEMAVPEPDPNVCRLGKDLNRDWGRVECPLEANKRYTFVYSRPFPVSTSYNPFHYSKLRFISVDGRTIACADMLLNFNRASSNVDELDMETVAKLAAAFSVDSNPGKH